MEYRASLKNAPVSAQKCRLVADLIRGMPVAPALETLEFSRQKAGGILHKLLFSALSNAENNHGADTDVLTVSTVDVGVGLRLGRIRPRARGRAARYLKHRCNIRLVLSDGEAGEAAAPLASLPAVAAGAREPGPAADPAEDAPGDGGADTAADGAAAADRTEEGDPDGAGESPRPEGARE